MCSCFCISARLLLPCQKPLRGRVRCAGCRFVHPYLIPWLRTFLESPPLAATLRQYNPVHTLTPYVLRTIFIIIFPVYAYVSQMVSSLQDFLPKFGMHFSSFLAYYTAHLRARTNNCSPASY